MGNSTKCFRLALFAEQGVAWSELGGPGWIFPELRVGTFQVYTSENQLALIMLNSRTGKFYRTAPREGPTGSGIERRMVDRYSSSQYSVPIEIPWYVKLKEHTGQKLHEFIQHLVSHLYVRPQFETNRNAAGHDALGYRAGTEIGVRFYVDGNPIPDTIIRKAPIDGDLMADKVLEGHKIALEFFGNTSEVTITGATTDYEMKDKRAHPDGRFMIEHDYQEEFGQPLVWITRGDNMRLNRGTAQEMTGSYALATTGPDTFPDTAFIMGAAASLYCSIPLITGDFTLMFWLKGYVPAMDIIGGAPSVVMLTVGPSTVLRVFDGANTYDTTITASPAAWTHYAVKRDGNRLKVYENGILIGNHALLSITNLPIAGGPFSIPVGQKSLFDVRLYASLISDIAITYYNTNMLNDKGNAFIW